MRVVTRASFPSVVQELRRNLQTSGFHRRSTENALVQVQVDRTSRAGQVAHRRGEPDQAEQRILDGEVAPREEDHESQFDRASQKHIA